MDVEHGTCWAVAPSLDSFSRPYDEWQLVPRCCSMQGSLPFRIFQGCRRQGLQGSFGSGAIAQGLAAAAGTALATRRNSAQRHSLASLSHWSKLGLRSDKADGQGAKKRFSLPVGVSPPACSSAASAALRSSPDDLLLVPPSAALKACDPKPRSACTHA